MRSFLKAFNRQIVDALQDVDVRPTRATLTQVTFYERYPDRKIKVMGWGTEGNAILPEQAKQITYIPPAAADILTGAWVNACWEVLRN